MRKFEKENEQAGGGCCYGVTGGAKAAFGMLSALFLSGVSENALAQCVATTDCATLGYTESSCPDGGVKCPFGDKWACLSGSSESVPSAKCDIGWILYSDKSCSSTENYDIRKTPIGVVVYTYPDGGGIAMALDEIASFDQPQRCFSYEGYSSCDILQEQCLAEKYTEDFASLIKLNETEAVRDFDSCGNTKILAENGYNLSSVAQYKTEGTSAGDWCVPAAGVIKRIVDEVDVLNATLRLVGAESELDCVKNGVYVYCDWSSSTLSVSQEFDNVGYYCENVYFYNWGLQISRTTDGQIHLSLIDSVRDTNDVVLVPVLEF